MRKTSNTTHWIERGSLRGLAAITLIGSLALFGCSTNKYPGNGEPGMSAPAAGPVAPNATSTPGSSSGSSPTPQAMISSSPAAGISASDDAIAVLKADEGYRGKVLGPAAPGTGAPSQSMQYPTGQFVSPSMYVNPQVTVNSSISSPPTPAIVSGAGEGVGGAVLAIPATTGVTAAAVAAPAVAAPVATGVTTSAITNARATPITNAGGLATVQAPAVNTGLTTAQAAASSAAATPILSTVGPVTQANNSAITGTNAGGGTLVTTASPTATNVSIAPVTVGNATAMNTTTTTSDRLMLGTPNTSTSRAITAGVGTTSTTANATPVRVETTSGGAIIVTNEKSRSAFQRFLNAIGLRRNAVTTGTRP